MKKCVTITLLLLCLFMGVAQGTLCTVQVNGHVVQENETLYLQSKNDVLIVVENVPANWVINEKIMVQVKGQLLELGPDVAQNLGSKEMSKVSGSKWECQITDLSYGHGTFEGYSIKLMSPQNDYSHIVISKFTIKIGTEGAKEPDSGGFNFDFGLGVPIVLIVAVVIGFIVLRRVFKKKVV